MQNSRSIEDPEIIAVTFSEFFIHIGSHLADKIPQVNDTPEQYLKGSNMQSFFLSPTLRKEFVILQLYWCLLSSTKY